MTTRGWFLDCFRIGVDFIGKRNHGVRELGPRARWYHQTSEERMGTRAWVQSCGYWLSHSCLCNETPIENWILKKNQDFLVGEHICVLGGWWVLIPYDNGMPYGSLYSLVLICSPSNKPVILSVLLSCILWIIEFWEVVGILTLVSVRSLGGLVGGVAHTSS
jgi:hypothetical protein